MVSNKPDVIHIHDKTFVPYISEAEIAQRVRELGTQIMADYADKNPIFLTILSGAFIFAADLARACAGMPSDWTFVRLSSYVALESSGEVKTHLNFDKELLKHRHIIIVEDIVDTALTLHHFLKDLAVVEPASVEIASFLVKRDAMRYPLSIRYFGFEIPTKFVVGYGLDYDFHGRNLPDIYQISNG